MTYETFIIYKILSILYRKINKEKIGKKDA